MVVMLVGIAAFHSARAAGAGITGVSKQSDGLICSVGQGLEAGKLRLEVYSPKVIRVSFVAGGEMPKDHSVSVIAHPLNSGWSFDQNAEAIELKTSALTARVDVKTGAVAFVEADGRVVLQEESSGGRTIEANPKLGAGVNRVIQNFVLQPDEAIFGLGQHSQGIWNYRGSTVTLLQQNREIAIPVLLSSKGYGVLWDNPAITDVQVGIEGAKNTLSWNSEAGESIDYYFMDGPSADEVIRGYRELTGAAPMLGKWAWGYWQSRERYVTQDQLLGVAREYRKRQIPIDNMVQDWEYWLPQQWGSHAFGKNFPAPKAMMDELHAAHFHAIISVWAKFEEGSKNYDQLSKAGLLFAPVYPNVYPEGKSKWYDAFNPAARKMYWQQISDELFSVGLDGWWLDATEPELGGNWGEIRDLKTGMGPGYTLANAYPLMTTTGVYQGQRAQTSDKRVFILTRSAYAGQQRNSAVSWSGDTSAEWSTFKLQIPAGLNFVSSGIPYWNSDIGGFFSRATSDETYRELFVRWFQFGSFCPMFRVHGTNAQKEMWAFGPQVEPILVKYDRLRYRLLPYIYSTAWRVTDQGYTMMRPLVMDFPEDPAARVVSDQFLMGPALMTCPVTEPSSTLSVIPANQLADRDGHVGGLSGTYYQGENFETKKLERVDPFISFDWDKVKREGVEANFQHDPLPGMEMDHFSAKWEGFLLTKSAGDYQISLSADDGMRMWVDGKLVVDDWKSRDIATHRVTLSLPGNARIPIRIEYYQNLYTASVELKWQPPGEGHVQQRGVYLPAGQWHDFWTGGSIEGGKQAKVDAPLETMPIFVRPGSILPMGPDIQYAMQASDPIELRVYPGADGSFSLYEDEGDGYAYEKKVYSIIPMKWDQKAGMLSIGKREGSFPGMLASHTFNIVFVGPGHGNGEAVTANPDRTVTYTGDPLTVTAAGR
jgi:alpha-D-xyloside xylohydrolase